MRMLIESVRSEANLRTEDQFPWECVPMVALGYE